MVILELKDNFIITLLKGSVTQDNTETQSWSLKNTPYNNQGTQLCHN